MKFAAFGLLLLSLTAVMAQELINPPELKISFDYTLVDTLQANFIKPLIEAEIKTLNLNQSYSVKYGPLSATIDNFKISDFSLDWTNTHILGPNAANQAAIQIKNLSVTLQFDADIRFLKLPFKGKGDTISIVGLDLEIALGFATFSNETSYAYIASVTCNVQDVETKLHPKIEDFLFIFIEKFGKIFGYKLPQIVSNVLIKTIVGYNETIQTMTTQGVNLVLMDLLQVQLSLANAPQIFNVGHDAYQSLSFNFDIVNIKTGEVAPTASSDQLVNYVPGGLPLQVMVSENMISQILWGALQTGKVNLLFSEGNTPENFPIPLNTDDLIILFPNLRQEYGYHKGCYFRVSKGGDYPIAFIRDGRLVLEIALLVDLIVDDDQTEYPVKQIADCKSCQTAVTMNLTVFAGINVYGIDSQHIGIRAMNAEVGNVNVLNGTLDGKSFRKTMNNLIIPMMGQMNNEIAGGIKNPLIGLFGIDDFAIEFGPDYLFLGLDLGSAQADLGDGRTVLSSYITGAI